MKVIETIKKHRKLFIILSAIILILLLDNIVCHIINYDVILERYTGGSGWIASNSYWGPVTLVSSKTGFRRIGLYYERYASRTSKITFLSTWNDDKFKKENDIYKSQDINNYSYFKKHDYLNEYDPLMIVGDYHLDNGYYTSYSQVSRVVIGSYIYYLRYEDSENYYKMNIEVVLNKEKGLMLLREKKH